MFEQHEAGWEKKKNGKSVGIKKTPGRGRMSRKGGPLPFE